MATTGAGDSVTSDAFGASHVVLTTSSIRVSAQPAAGGATLTWNGSVSTDWNNAANWTPAAVPQAADDAIIAAASTEPSLTSAVTVNNVTIASGASLTTNGQTLTVGGTLTNNGLLETVDDTTSSISGALTNNGTLLVQAGAFLGHISDPATLTVSGTLTNTGTGTIELTEQGCCNNNGVPGTAELDVSGTLANSGTISVLPGQQSGSDVLRVNALTGTINVSGGLGLDVYPYTASTLTSSATVTAEGAPITVFLPAGGSFTNTGTLTASSGYPITVNGGTFDPGSGATIGDVELAGAALAPGTIASGSSLKLTASSTAPGSLVNNGTLTLAGSTLAGPLTNTGQILVTSGTTNTLGGQFTNSGTLEIVAGDCAVGAAPVVSGTLTNTSTGTIELTQTGADCLSAPGAASLFVTGTLVNDGTISAVHGDNGGDRILIGIISNQSDGTITTANVGLTLSNASLTNNGTISVGSGEPLNISGAVTLAGSGTYQANVVNSGQLTVGTPVGSLNVTGSYQQGTGATLNLALSGTASGSFSQLTFSGPATLAGTLNTTFANGFAPALGDSFRVLAASSVSGTFASITTPPGFTLSGTYGPSDVTLVGTSGPQQMSITPSSGGDTGTVTVQIALPSPAAPGATAKLSRAGYSDIPGSYTSLSSDGLFLTTTFDLTGQADGAWDVVVTGSDGTISTLPGGFTVEPGQAPQIWVNIIGRPVVRPGTPTTFTVEYGNNGNIDAIGAPIWVVGLPANAIVDPGFQIVAPPSNPSGIQVDTSEIPTAIAWVPQGVTSIPVGSGVPEGSGLLAYPLIIPVVPAGSTGSLQFTVIVGTNTAAVNITAFSQPVCGTSDSVGQQQTVVTSSPWTNCLNAIWNDIKADLGPIIPFYGCKLALTQFDQYMQVAARSVINGRTVWGWFQFIVALINAGSSCAATVALAAAAVTVVASFALGPVAGVVLSLLVGGTLVLTAASLTAIPGTFEVALDLKNLLKDCRAALKPASQSSVEEPVEEAEDPNGKVGPQGSGPQQYVSPTRPLSYEVFFENQPTAALPAQRVVVTDQLDPTKVDLSTFTLGPISFDSTTLEPRQGASTFQQNIDLRPATNLIVQVSAGLNRSTGLVTWTFTSIDPATGLPPQDPTVGFLPPDLSPPEGEGSVLYNVLPKAGLASGTQITNQATITFDANAPITTSPWLNTIDNSIPTSQVAALPTTESSPAFQVQWSGTDNFSGISDFTIYVSVNGGPFTPWIETSDTSATYPGQPGNTYSFYSLATSNVGTVESTKTAAEATTTVLHSTALTYSGPVNGDYDDAVTLAATLTDTSASSAAAVGGVPITLSLGTQSCTGTTDTAGTATCSVTLNQIPGNVTVSANFAGNSTYASSTTTPTLFTIGTEETTLTTTSRSTLAANAVSVSARLLEDGRTVPNPGGQTVTFTATPSGGGSPVTGTATIDATGTATAALALTPGSYSLTASFGGDSFYQPATAGTQTLVVYQPTTFVIWGGNLPIPAGQPANVTIGQDCTFWGPQWTAQIQSGDFQANPSFKGFATSISGSTWTSAPGASSSPPATIATYISVIVSTSVTKKGNVESGNIAEIVVLKVDNPAGYQPNPGSPGSGLMVAVLQ